MGGDGVGQIKIKDQLSPAKAEIRAELGKISFSEVYYAQQQNHTLLNANVLAEQGFKVNCINFPLRQLPNKCYFLLL